MADAPFVPNYLSEPWPNAYDPVIFPGEHFDDGLHRVLVMVNTEGVKKIYKTSDFDTFTLVNGDWMSSVPNNGSNTFQAAVWRGETCLLYQNDASESATALWTGTASDIDSGTITKQGRVITEGDCGAFYDADTDTVHLFTEDGDTPFGSVSSTKLSHWTTPGDDLLNATQQADAIDTGGSWGTGDPHVIEAFGCYWMFTDYTTQHPTYWIALYRSDDLTTWELIDATFTSEDGTRGGDFDVIDVGDHLFALSEYTGSGGGDIGVGVWRLDKVPARSFQPVSPGRRTTINGTSYAVRAWPY